MVLAQRVVKFYKFIETIRKYVYLDILLITSYVSHDISPYVIGNKKYFGY